MKVDINLLPEEQRPKRWKIPLAVALLVFILAAGYYGYGFYDKNAIANDELEQLHSQLDLVKAEAQKIIDESPVAEYEQRIAGTQEEIDNLQVMEKDYEIYNADRIYWKPVLQAIRELAPTDVKILSFEQNENEIVVEGELSPEVQDTIVIVEYTKLLEQRGIFSRLDFDISTEERDIDEGEETVTRQVFIFTILLEVKPGGTQ